MTDLSPRRETPGTHGSRAYQSITATAPAPYRTDLLVRINSDNHDMLLIS